MLCTRTCLRGAVAFGLIAALTPFLAAQSLQQKHIVKSRSGTDAPRSLSEVQQTATAQGGLIWFTNQADFEAFNAGEGRVLRGIEDYEEALLPPRGRRQIR